MTYPLRSRAERAKLHVAMLAALPPISEAEAFADAICWADTDGIADLGVLFSLADAIDHHVYQAVYYSDCQYAEVSADDLRVVHGTPTVNLALKLVGVCARQRGRKMIWTDAPNGEPTALVSLPDDLLEQWYSE